MKIVLATGIYPPDIGGPATYVRALAAWLKQCGVDVTVVTYGREDFHDQEEYSVVRVARVGGPLVRWIRYARALRKVAADADVIEAFSSVSVGVPLIRARLEKPKKVLRLGGDFMWERYTDWFGLLSLGEWYQHKSLCFLFFSFWYQKLLQSFDYIIFSTRFQEELYEEHYRDLPSHSVIENAVPEGAPVLHQQHEPFRLLFVGRFVRFKNLPSLVCAMRELPGFTLTIAGDGPMKGKLKCLTRRYKLDDRVIFQPPHTREARPQLFHEHDLLVLPSVTEISPNVALEARLVGLPVLLTRETGLTEQLTAGMVLKDLSTPEAVRNAVIAVTQRYAEAAQAASSPAPPRSGRNISEEHLTLFKSLVT